MIKTHTKMRAGQAVAVYVEDGQGRRLVIAREESSGIVQNPVILAATQTEARAAIGVLRQLMEELPP